ncbi:MFS transporter [Curtobacterium sp. RRHDQ10]|uniref:MFS transporter n=1 Tax=Curtobacterium phyllosphaerae TaxID=3413379 RepID=UPI003BF3456E
MPPDRPDRASWERNAARDWDGHDRGSREYRRILVALLGAGIATFAQLYAPQGILPTLARDLRVDPSRSGLLISAATIGLALAVLPWSLVADRIGRVRAMRIALIAATVFGLVMPWSPTFPVLIAVRVLEGVALGGIPAIAVTYLGEEIRPRHAALAAGTYVSGTTIGGLLGRLVAGPVADVAGWRVGTFSVAVLAGVAAVVFFVATPVPRGFRRRSVSVRSVAAAMGRHLRNARLLVLYGQGFLLMGGFVAMYNYLTFRLEAPPFALPTALASLLFLAYLAGTVSSRTAGGLADRLGRRRIMLASTAVMMVGAVVTLSGSLVFVVVGLVVMTAGFFGAHSIASGWAGARATADRAQSTSLYNFWYYAGSSLFGFLGGVAFVGLGWGGVVAMVVVLCVVAGVWASVAGRDGR